MKVEIYLAVNHKPNESRISNKLQWLTSQSISAAILSAFEDDPSQECGGGVLQLPCECLLGHGVVVVLGLEGVEDGDEVVVLGLLRHGHWADNTTFTTLAEGKLLRRWKTCNCCLTTATPPPLLGSAPPPRGQDTVHLSESRLQADHRHRAAMCHQHHPI